MLQKILLSFKSYFIMSYVETRLSGYTYTENNVFCECYSMRLKILNLYKRKGSAYIESAYLKY